MVGDKIGQACWGLEYQAREIGHFLVSNRALWIFLHGWHRVEVTNNGPSEGISAKLPGCTHATIPWDKLACPDASSESLSLQQSSVGKNTVASEPVTRTIPL